MIKIEAFKTSDGTVHLSQGKAKKHAERVYGEALTSLAHKAIQVQKYTDMCQFIEDNLGAFLRLNALKLDLVVVDEEGDNE